MVGFLMISGWAWSRKMVRIKWAFNLEEWMPSQSRSSGAILTTLLAAWLYFLAVVPPPATRKNLLSAFSWSRIRRRNFFRYCQFISSLGMIRDPPREMI